MKGKGKKNQLIIVALAVMIAAAGYLNYTGRLFGENAKGTKEANADLTNQELLDISQEDTEAGSEEIESNDTIKPHVKVMALDALRILSNI